MGEVKHLFLPAPDGGEGVDNLLSSTYKPLHSDPPQHAKFIFRQQKPSYQTASNSIG